MDLVAHESLILPPLRAFPTPISRDPEQRDRGLTEHLRSFCIQFISLIDISQFRGGLDQPFREFSDVASEVHFDHHIKEHDWSSRDSSLSDGDGSLDQDEDLDLCREELTNLPQSTHQASRVSASSAVRPGQH